MEATHRRVREIFTGDHQYCNASGEKLQLI